MDLIKIWKKLVGNYNFPVFLVWLKIGCLVSHVYHGCSNISCSQHNQKKKKKSITLCLMYFYHSINGGQNKIKYNKQKNA